MFFGGLASAHCRFSSEKSSTAGLWTKNPALSTRKRKIQYRRLVDEKSAHCWLASEKSSTAGSRANHPVLSVGEKYSNAGGRAENVASPGRSEGIDGQWAYSFILYSFVSCGLVVYSFVPRGLVVYFFISCSFVSCGLIVCSRRGNVCFCGKVN